MFFFFIAASFVYGTCKIPLLFILNFKILPFTSPMKLNFIAIKLNERPITAFWNKSFPCSSSLKETRTCNRNKIASGSYIFYAARHWLKINTVQPK